MGAVAQLADVHTGTSAYVLFPVEGAYAVRSVFDVLFYIFCHRVCIYVWIELFTMFPTGFFQAEVFWRKVFARFLLLF